MLPGEIRVVEYAGSFFREAAVSVQPRGGPETDEGKIRPDRARISLLAICTSSFRILSSRFVEQCLFNQAYEAWDHCKTLRS